MESNNPDSFSFKQPNPFGTFNSQSNTFLEPTPVKMTINIESPKDDLYFNQVNTSPKFNVKVDDFVDEIPSSNLNFEQTVKHEIERKTSINKVNEGPKHLSNNQVYAQKEEIEHAKKSHFEYLKLMRDNKDPLGVQASGGLREITRDELALHNKTNDLWIALHNQVFNLTLYLDYHPGGEKQLMKGAGKDATDLFNNYHPWVNYHNLIGKLQIGYLKN